MTDRFAHLVGSVNLPDAESTFTVVSDHLGGRLHRIPDGEVGDRYYWIQLQNDYFDATPGLTASKVVPEFGVATECGFGCGPRERTVVLLDLHEAVAASL